MLILRNSEICRHAARLDSKPDFETSELISSPLWHCLNTTAVTVHIERNEKQFDNHTYFYY